MNVMIRELDPSTDMSLCVQASKEGYLATHLSESWGSAAIKDIQDRLTADLLKNKFFGFSATIDGLPVAIILANGDVGHTDIFVINLYVAPDFREQGIGRRLMQHLIDFARSKELSLMDLAVTATNTPAVELYKSLGFEVTRYRMTLDL